MHTVTQLIRRWRERKFLLKCIANQRMRGGVFFLPGPRGGVEIII